MFLKQGSGKTLAFGIPLLSRLLDVRKSVGYYKDENSDNDVKQEGSLLKVIHNTLYFK